MRHAIYLPETHSSIVRYRMKTALCHSLLLLILLIYPCAAYSLQKPGGREDATEESPKGKRASRPRSNESKQTGAPASRTAGGSRSKESVSRGRQPATATRPLAGLIINVNPPDSEVLFDSRSVTPENGTVRLPEVVAGTHTIEVRKAAYRGTQSSIMLSAGESRVLNIDLRPLPGKLSVAPTVAGATIIISSVGSYIETINNLELSPGMYEVTVTKPGYKTSVRNALVRPDESTNLLIPLERVPAKRRPADDAMTIAVSSEGKYLLVSLTGASGQSATATGSVEVTLAPNDSSGHRGQVVGLLPGVPCRVNVVPLENVGESSFKEPPGISNQWRAVAVRFRPKNLKRAVRFLISWQVIQ
jgi:hypothetical protein